MVFIISSVKHIIESFISYFVAQICKIIHSLIEFEKYTSNVLLDILLINKLVGRNKPIMFNSGNNSLNDWSKICILCCLAGLLLARHQVLIRWPGPSNVDGILATYCYFGLDLIASRLVGVSNLAQLIISSPNLVKSRLFCYLLPPASPLPLPCVCVCGVDDHVI
jgi:hypothetical protein